MTVEIELIHLDYAGDSADLFLGFLPLRGASDGEIMLGSWMSWMTGEITHKDEDKSQLQGNDPQTRVLGPIEDFPDGDTQGFAKGGRVYYQKRDCPVENNINVEWNIWDDDSSRTARSVGDALLMSIAAAAAQAGALARALTAADIQNAYRKLIEEILADGSTPLGRFSGFIDIDDPCNAPKGVVLDVTRRVDLTNTSPAAAWPAGRPELNGFLQYKVKVRHLIQKSSSTTDRDPRTHTDLLRFDIGQPDEAVFTGLIEVAAPIPEGQSLDLEYWWFLNTDNNFSTGATPFPERGAEFAVRVSFALSTGPTAQLLRWNGASGQFEVVPGAIVDLGLDLARQAITVSVEAQYIGAPTTLVASWAAVKTAFDVLDVIPDQPETMPIPAVTPTYAFSGSVPFVTSVLPNPNDVDVARATTIEVDFNKTMNHPSVEAAFSIAPAVPGAFSWEGTRLVFTPVTPLNAFAEYRVTLTETATDSVGTPLDGDDDGVAGGAFEWMFKTETVNLFPSTAQGVATREFGPGQAVFAFGRDLASHSSINLYVIVHTRLTDGALLSDVSNDGVNIVQTDGSGNFGPVQLWNAIPSCGEFNVIGDVNGNGLFDTLVDRVDRLAIGFVTSPDDCDTDAIPDPIDNCPLAINPDQADGDLDGLGDACDTTTGTRGDRDADGDVDLDDIAILLADLGRAVSGSACGRACDLDADGTITALDARRLTLLCTRPRCDTGP